LYIYFDMFEAQTESFCKRHCKVPALILFDSGVTQRFYFSDEVPALLLLDMAAFINLINNF
jgi:hypothetical protein